MSSTVQTGHFLLLQLLVAPGLCVANDPVQDCA